MKICSLNDLLSKYKHFKDCQEIDKIDIPSGYKIKLKLKIQK